MVHPKLNLFSLNRRSANSVWNHESVVEGFGTYTFFKASRNNSKQTATIKVGDPRSDIVKFEAELLLNIQQKWKFCFGLPKILGYFENSFAQSMIIESFGPSLKSLHKYQNGFSLKTVLMIADQLLISLAKLHSWGISHGNINSRNVRVGCSNRVNQITLINLENAKVMRSKVGSGSVSDYDEVLKSQCKDIQDLWKLIEWGISARDYLGNTITPRIPEQLHKFEQICKRFESNGGNQVHKLLRNQLFDCYEQLEFPADGKFDWSM